MSGAGDKDYCARKRSPALVRYGSRYCAAALSQCRKWQHEAQSCNYENVFKSFQHKAAALEFDDGIYGIVVRDKRMTVIGDCHRPVFAALDAVTDPDMVTDIRGITR